MPLDCNSTSRVDFQDFFSSKTAEKSQKILQKNNLEVLGNNDYLHQYQT